LLELKFLRRRSRVFIAAECLPWVGFNFDELATNLSDCGIGLVRAKPFQASATIEPSLDADFSCIGTTGRAWLPEAVQYATCIETEKLPAEISNEDRVVTQRHYAHYSRLVEWYTAQLIDTCTELVLIVQGFELTNAAIRRAALDLDIKVVAIENTSRQSRLLWDNVSGITTNRNLAKNYYWRSKDGDCHADLDQYIEEIVSTTRQEKSQEHQSPEKGYESNGKPYVLYVGQVYTDSSLVFGCRDWTGPVELLERLAQWCDEHNFRLVAKLHPKEIFGRAPITGGPYAKLTWRKICQSALLQERIDAGTLLVDYENTYDTYSLINDCCFVVTFNSQTGLEALIRDKPLLLCGDAYYGGVGLTTECGSPHSLNAVLDAGIKSNFAEAKRFTYIYFEKYCIEKSITSFASFLRSIVFTTEIRRS